MPSEDRSAIRPAQPEQPNEGWESTLPSQEHDTRTNWSECQGLGQEGSPITGPMIRRPCEASNSERGRVALLARTGTHRARSRPPHNFSNPE
jgi:hypothetical protein